MDDLQTEAWLVAEELSRDRDPPPDAGDKTFHQQILGRLYNRFVSFADKRLRFAVRLDEQSEDDDGGMRENPIAAALAAPEDSDPAQALATREGECTQEQQILGRFAEAVAYLRVFANMGNDRPAIADHLAIAACTLRRRLRRAERTVQLQPSLFDGITTIPDNFMPPRLARKFRAGSNEADGAPTAPRQARLLVRAYVPIRVSNGSPAT